MTGLRHGELLLNQCAGGKCAVCKELITPGRAVQLNCRSSRIRHVEGLPKTDTRTDPRNRRRDIRQTHGDR